MPNGTKLFSLTARGNTDTAASKATSMTIRVPRPALFKADSGNTSGKFVGGDCMLIAIAIRALLVDSDRALTAAIIGNVLDTLHHCYLEVYRTDELVYGPVGLVFLGGSTPRVDGQATAASGDIKMEPFAIAPQPREVFSDKDSLSLILRNDAVAPTASGALDIVAGLLFSR